jgi:dynein heavy chain
MYILYIYISKSTFIKIQNKVMHEELPVLFAYAIASTSGKDPAAYECPIYRKPKRTDDTYVGSFDLHSDRLPSHWVLRGVAILCDIK